MANKLALKGWELNAFLEAAKWADKVSTANAKKMIEALLSERGGAIKFARYMMSIARIANEIKHLEFNVAVSGVEQI